MDNSIIAKVQSFGFTVYMRKPSDTWLYFTTPDGKSIGYLQDGRLEGISLGTVHVPNRTSGTGFQVERNADALTKEDLQRCFAAAPHWAGRDAASVVKWRDIDAMIAANIFNREYHVIAPIAAEA